MTPLLASPTLFTLECVNCGQQFDQNSVQSCPHCQGSVLKGRYPLDRSQIPHWLQQLQHRPPTLWRYRELLPVRHPDYITTLGEGYTPLIPCQSLGRLGGGCQTLYLKDERQNPTGSFKDRQATVAISFLKEQGVKSLVLASTGNVGISYAAYARRAGLDITIFFPAHVPPEKMRETQLYGSRVIQLDENYDVTKVAAAQYAQEHGLFLDRGIKGFAGVESMKTMAYEMAEQLGWKAPDWYIQGVSGGMGPIGVAQGFEELVNLGLVDKVPALGLVQAAGCAPLANAWATHASQATPCTPNTAILPLATGDPGIAYHILKNLLDRHGGAITTVTDEMAFDTVHTVATQEGVSVEPATAVAIAGAINLIQQGVIKPHETVIINCSGHTYPVTPQILHRQW